MKKEPNFKRKITINILISLIIIIGVGYFVIFSTSEDIKEIKTDTEDLRIDLEEKYIRGQSLRKLSESLKMIELQIPKLDEIFIKQSEAVDFITTLEEISDNTGVGQKINLSGAQKAEGGICSKTSIQLVANGSFANQMRYLGKLESLNYHINIRVLEISMGSRGRAEGEGNIINMIVSANTYWVDD